MARMITWSDLEPQRTLGEGKAGRVILAKLKTPYLDLKVGARCAVKIYKDWVLDQPGQLERIVREAEVGRRISHPNLVGTLALIFDSAKRPALVMRYYEGRTLDSYLESHRKRRVLVPMGTVVQVLRGLANALRTLHAESAIHRDVKPANIILTRQGPVLMDLGVVQHNDYAKLTTDGTFLGTIRYAAPEYLFGRDYDARIDVYSVGAIALELLVNELFLSHHQHWTELVRAERTYLNLNFRLVQSLRNLNCAEFTRYLVENTLVPMDRRIISAELFEATQCDFWKVPFVVVGRNVETGAPSVRRVGAWADSEPEIPLEEAASDLFKRLTDWDRRFLRELFDVTYWDDAPDTLWVRVDVPHQREMKARLEGAGVLGPPLKHPDDHNRLLHALHPTLRVLYRYGYL